MYTFYSGFLPERMKFASGPAAETGGRSGRARFCGMRVPWLRVDPRVEGSKEDFEGRSRVKHNRLAELVNQSLYALEKLSTGHLNTWFPRSIAKHGDSIDMCEISGNSCHGRVAPRSFDLLSRLLHFWEDLDQRYREAGWGYFGDAGVPPQKFSVYPQGSDSQGGFSRGDVVPAVLDFISVPSVDPVPIEHVSERVKRLMEDWRSHMLLSEVSRRPGPNRTFEDPLFRTRSGKMGLAKILHGAGMLRWNRRQSGPAVRCFTVLKKYTEEGRQVQRLIFDLRPTNELFAPPLLWAL